MWIMHGKYKYSNKYRKTKMHFQCFVWNSLTFILYFLSCFYTTLTLTRSYNNCNKPAANSEWSVISTAKVFLSLKPKLRKPSWGLRVTRGDCWVQQEVSTSSTQHQNKPPHHRPKWQWPGTFLISSKRLEKWNKMGKSLAKWDNIVK